MTKPCPKCNQPNPAEAAFCLNCASPLVTPSRQAEPPPFIGQQPGAQNWPPAGGPVQPSSGSEYGQKAVAAFILAILALFCCGPISGVPAAIVGWLELDSIKNGRSPAGGRWMALVGLWGGIISSIIHVGIYFLWILMSMLSAGSDPYYY
ncbi:MAG TPA: hypothetical protein PKE66_12865 [Pyrinomonadaceae bacterium]|nr:hypothetical protein [Pyrinomonadaceae bacterium]